jgi:hypothetical protein
MSDIQVEILQQRITLLERELSAEREKVKLLKQICRSNHKTIQSLKSMLMIIHRRRYRYN